jgi:hypothetical protein
MLGVGSIFCCLVTWLIWKKMKDELVGWFGWLLRGVYGSIETMWSSKELPRTQRLLWMKSKLPLGFGFRIVMVVTLVHLFCIGVLILWVVSIALFNLLYFVRDWIPLVLPYNKYSLIQKKMLLSKFLIWINNLENF